MPVFAFALVIETFPLYALRSKKKPIFPNHVRSFQNQDLELTHIFSKPIKMYSLSILTAHLYLVPIPISRKNPV